MSVGGVYPQADPLQELTATTNAEEDQLCRARPTEQDFSRALVPAESAP